MRHEVPLTATLTISFQRYPRPGSGLVSRLATSCGALPVVRSGPRRFPLPCPAEEAFWIGLVRDAGGPAEEVRVWATVSSGDRLDVLTGERVDPPTGDERASVDPPYVTVPPVRGIAGIAAGPGQWWAFSRVAASPAVGCRSLEVSRLTGDLVRIDIVDAAHFERLTQRRLPRLDPSSRYSGRRLP